MLSVYRLSYLSTFSHTPPKIGSPIPPMKSGGIYRFTLKSANMTPKIKKITGEMVNISQLDSVEVTLITLQDADNDLHTVSTSNKYWKAVGRFFQIGSIVAVEAEERVKDVTEYTDANGNVKKHTSDGLNLTKISAYSSNAWGRSLKQQTIREMEQALLSVELERAPAFAAFYGQALQALK